MKQTHRVAGDPIAQNTDLLLGAQIIENLTSKFIIIINSYDGHLYKDLQSYNCARVVGETPPIKILLL